MSIALIIVVSLVSLGIGYYIRTISRKDPFTRSNSKILITAEEALKNIENFSSTYPESPIESGYIKIENLEKTIQQFKTVVNKFGCVMTGLEVFMARTGSKEDGFVLLPTVSINNSNIPVFITDAGLFKVYHNSTLVNKIDIEIKECDFIIQNFSNIKIAGSAENNNAAAQISHTQMRPPHPN